MLRWSQFAAVSFLAVLSLAAPAKTIDLVLPWQKQGEKAYTLAISYEHSAHPANKVRTVTVPLTMRTLSRGEDEGIVRWQFGPAAVDGDECATTAGEVQLALHAGAVRPAVDMRIEDYGGLDEVTNRKSAFAAFMALLDEHPQLPCRHTDEAFWREQNSLDSHGHFLAGDEAKLFIMLMGAPLDSTEPTIYDDTLDFPISMATIEATAEWRVVSQDARQLIVEWTRKPDPKLAASALRRVAMELREREWLTEAEADDPDNIEGRETARIVIDRKSGWPTELSYERFARVTDFRLIYRVAFRAR